MYLYNGKHTYYSKDNESSDFTWLFKSKRKFIFCIEDITYDMWSDKILLKAWFSSNKNISLYNDITLMNSDDIKLKINNKFNIRFEYKIEPKLLINDIRLKLAKNIELLIDNFTFRRMSVFFLEKNCHPPKNNFINLDTDEFIKTIKIYYSESDINTFNYKKWQHSAQKFTWVHNINLRLINIDNKNLFDLISSSNEDDYLLFVDNRCLIKDDYIKILESISTNNDVIANGYNAYYNSDFIARVRRINECLCCENEQYILYGICIKKRIVSNCKHIKDIIDTIKNVPEDSILYIDIEGYNIELREGKNKKTKLIPFYLPQYHESEENNKWWGKGFTEWNNVKRAKPFYKGHNQPRVPKDLGYYSLDSSETQKKQVVLAKEFDIFGFCYYYYWFSGKKVLYKPLQQLLNTDDIDFPFCICWANESWTRSWDGLTKDILIEQIHNKKTDNEFIKDVIPVLKDDRYIKINGEPLLLIYRINLFSNPKETIDRWRDQCKKAGIPKIKVAVVKSFDCVENNSYGADFAIDFPPHNTYCKPVNNDMVFAYEDFQGNIFDYAQLVKNRQLVQFRYYNYIPSVMLNWDNTARRMGNSDSWINFDENLFKRWFLSAHLYSIIYSKEKYIFFNAWNEWAEGTYLEPDLTYGKKFLKMINKLQKVF